MRVSHSFKLIAISTLFVIGLAACKPGTTTTETAASTPPAPAPKIQALDQRALDLMAKIKAKARNRDVTGGSWSTGDGVEIAPKVEFVYFTDRFGEKPNCQVSFKGIDAHDGSEAIPKWSLDLGTNLTSKLPFVVSASFFGPNKSIRVILDDGSESPLELNESMGGDNMRLTLSGNVMDRFMRAKRVTLNHGMAGARRVEFIFDTSSFPLAVQLLNALCPM